MDNILQLEALICLSSVIKQDGLIALQKLKLDQYKKLHGQLMEQYVLEVVEVVMLSMDKLLIGN